MRKKPTSPYVAPGVGFIRDLGPGNQKLKVMKPVDVLKLVGKCAEIPYYTILKPTRKQEVLIPRWIYLYLLVTYQGQSARGLGKTLDMDPTTILHAIGSVKEMLQVSNDTKVFKIFQRVWEALTKKLNYEDNHDQRPD